MDLLCFSVLCSLSKILLKNKVYCAVNCDRLPKNTRIMIGCTMDSIFLKQNLFFVDVPCGHLLGKG